MKQLQKSQDEKMAALTTLLQQSMDAEARIAMAVGAGLVGLARRLGA